MTMPSGPVLAKLGKQICSSRNNIELLQTITAAVKPFIPFTDSCIRVKDSLIGNDGMQLKQEGSPMLLPNGHGYALATELKVNGELLGVWYLDAPPQTEDPFSKEHFEIAECFAGFVSIALNSILKHEEAETREQEKAILLSLSEDIAAIRNKADLLRIIIEKIKPLFNFYNTGILMIGENGYFHDLSVTGAEIDNSEINRNLREGLFYPASGIEYNGSTLQHLVYKLLTTNHPEVFDYTNDYSAHTTANLMDVLKKAGYKKGVAGLLKNGTVVIGVFMINYKDELMAERVNLGLFQNIVNQLSVAIANILFQQQIEQREQEKAILLSISNEISLLRDLEGFLQWLHDKAQSMLLIDIPFITLISAHTNKVRFVLGTANAAVQQSVFGRVRKGISDTGLPYHNTYFEHVEEFFDGQVYVLAHMPATVAHKPTAFVETLGIAESITMVMRDKGEIIGHICLHSKTAGHLKGLNVPFLRNFVNQISIALVNILSNEEAVEREKQKALEIDLNNAVLMNETFGEVLRDLSLSIQKAVGCDLCYIQSLAETSDAGLLQFIGEKKDGKFAIFPLELKLSGQILTGAEVRKMASNFLTALNEPAILWGIELEEMSNQFPFLQLFIERSGVRSFLFVPLKTKNHSSAFLVVGSKLAYAYEDADLALVKNITGQLSLALDNRFAFQQIKHLTEMLEMENLYLNEQINDNYNFNEIIGGSGALQNVFEEASLVAETDSTVLLIGETGTGKELVARAIHNLSARKDKPLIKVNCACLPAQLVESELFGHEKGSFTGAIDKRIGKFELANEGTIFLDEIGELPLELQAKLLRVLQEKEFERLGGKTTLKADIRIIAATNKNLEEETLNKRFRSDLYYRLNVYPILLPPLRERKEDIPLLAMHFAKKFGAKMRKTISAIQTDALQEMMVYNWPGNVRELEHVIEHSVISCKSTKLSLGKPLLVNEGANARSIADYKIKTLQENERAHIISILRHCKGRVRGEFGAAKLLNVNANTLESRMQKLGIKKELVFET